MDYDARFRGSTQGIKNSMNSTKKRAVFSWTGCSFPRCTTRRLRLYPEPWPKTGMAGCPGAGRRPHFSRLRNSRRPRGSAGNVGEGKDEKVICVSCGDPVWGWITDLDHLPQSNPEISHFFDIYKDPGKQAGKSRRVVNNRKPGSNSRLQNATIPANRPDREGCPIGGRFLAPLRCPYSDKNTGLQSWLGTNLFTFFFF